MTITRKTIAAALAVGLLLAFAAPATAGKKKGGSFAAENLPFPGPNGCLEGVEGLHKTTQEVKTPFAGVFTLTMESFEGDWDLFLTDAEGNEIASSTTSQLTGDPPTEEVVVSVTKGMSLAMVACNWAGGPSAEVKWSLVAK